MTEGSYIWALLTMALTAVLSAVLMIPTRCLAVRHGVMCMPNSRSSHSVPVPRAGGVAFVTAASLAWIVIAWTSAGWWLGAITVAGLLVAAAGFVDDVRGLSARVRLGIQVACGLALGATTLSWGDGAAVQAAVAATGIAIGLAWFANMFNFMDGISGLAASEGAFCAASLALVARATGGDEATVLALASLAGCLLGFLPWNTPTARIFMGDVGSTWIGFVIAAVGLHHAVDHPEAIPAMVILPTLFLADTGVCLVRRAWRGDPLSHAHRTHGFQNLSRRFHSHGKVVLLFLAGNAILGACAAWALAEPEQAWMIAGIVLVSASLLALAAQSGVPGVADDSISHPAAGGR